MYVVHVVCGVVDGKDEWEIAAETTACRDMSWHGAGPAHTGVSFPSPSSSFTKPLQKYTRRFKIPTQQAWIPSEREFAPFSPHRQITFSTQRKVITGPLGFQNGVGLLCTTACCVRDHCGEKGRELHRHKRLSGRREIGMSHERGWATSSSLQRK